MKRFSLICLFLLCALAACGSDTSGGTNSTSTTTKSQPTPTPTPTPKTAQQIAQALKDAGLPIGDVTVLTESTDSNHLMNKPGQYTSKVYFVDTRITQNMLGSVYNKDISPGGSIEVFASSADAQKRYNYLYPISTSGPAMFAEWEYPENYVLLRLSSVLTKDQAGEYDTKLQAVLK